MNRLATRAALSSVVLFAALSPARAVTFNVFANISAEYLGGCWARYSGYVAAQAINLEADDNNQQWDLLGNIRNGGRCQSLIGATVTQGSSNGVLPYTTLLSINMQTDQVCFQTGGPWYWSEANASLHDPNSWGPWAYSDCHRISNCDPNN